MSRFITKKMNGAHLFRNASTLWHKLIVVNILWEIFLTPPPPEKMFPFFNGQKWKKWHRGGLKWWRWWSWSKRCWICSSDQLRSTDFKFREWASYLRKRLLDKSVEWKQSHGTPLTSFFCFRVLHWRHGHPQFQALFDMRLGLHVLCQVSCQAKTQINRLPTTASLVSQE